ncbi:PrsW family intramembrane metalloprotease [Sediminivirga luteola]|uniref:Protease PrsW n=2 Tax=Sediminivirga luteola TaxID=1774748 RepID=A0A8J2TZ71_9MICO|nr:PrsW family intramembrane metalloprotease [Sediminivirga luteola]MCI2267177.1 PrsW family intramembrane metalloprotease [Sediminivirga luteola]GGA19237.1 protease PrsW [Sediminivirga luteola]
MDINRQAGRRRLWIIWPVVAAATMIGSVVWVSAQIGIAWVGAGLALSVIVVTPVILAFLWLNRWHRGRPRLLVSAFVWGASVAAFCSIWTQAWLHDLVNVIWGADVGAWVRPLMITPVTEEVLKGLFLLWLLIYRRREVTGVLDAIVFAGLIGIGFSFIENSLYFGRPLMEVVQSGGADTAAVATLGVTLFMRVAMVPFFHSLMVAITAIGIGIAAHRRGRAAKVLPVLLGLLAAIVLHGIWDWAGLASSDQFLIFKVYGAVMVPVFLAVFIVALVLRHRQGRMITEGAEMLVRDGDIASEEAMPLANLRARRRWRADIRRHAGRAAARAVARYQSEASALAIRLTRGTPADQDWLPEQRRIVTEARAGIHHRRAFGRLTPTPFRTQQ